MSVELSRATRRLISFLQILAKTSRDFVLPSLDSTLLVLRESDLFLGSPKWAKSDPSASLRSDFCH